MVACANSWKREPFTVGRPIPYQATFDEAQLERIKEGLVPREMEDKWFIYFEEPYLFFHRSWTGLPAYRITLRAKEGGADAVDSQWSKELAETSGQGPEYHAELIEFLIFDLLLGESKPFPMPRGVDESKARIFQHHVSGTGFPEKKAD